MNKNNKFDSIGIDVEGDILFITVAKYKLFLSYGKKGADALMLYLHYMFTARIQATNSVWANNSYIREGLDWSRDRLKDAKKLLIQLELIEQKQEKTTDGTFGKPYVVVKTKTTPFEINKIEDKSTGVLKNRPPVQPLGGKKDTNALTNKRNALTKKANTMKIPPLQEISDYISVKGYDVDPKFFFEFYESSNWCDVKGNKVKNWKQKIITWNNRAKTSVTNNSLRPKEKGYAVPEGMDIKDVGK